MNTTRFSRIKTLFLRGLDKPGCRQRIHDFKVVDTVLKRVKKSGVNVVL